MSPAQYKSLRKKVGTQHDVAALLGVSRPTIARREAPNGRITEEAAIAILSLPALSDEQSGISREKRMRESGKFEPLEWDYVDEIAKKASDAKSQNGI